MGLSAVAHPCAAVGVRRRTHWTDGRALDSDGARRSIPLFHLVLNEQPEFAFVVLVLCGDSTHAEAQWVFHHRIKIQVVVLIGPVSYTHLTLPTSDLV